MDNGNLMSGDVVLISEDAFSHMTVRHNMAAPLEGAGIAGMLVSATAGAAAVVVLS